MIIFNIATVERRKKMFMDVLRMLKNQTIPCDHINIAMSYAAFDSDVVQYLQKHFASYHIKWRNGMPCEYKMYGMQRKEVINKTNVYFATMDDDIDYPVDYFERLKNKIDQYDRKAVVGFHGIRFDKFPVIHYKAQKKMFQYFKEVEVDTPVHVIGTGCLGFYAGTLINKGFDFPTINNKINCLDGSFGRWCRDNSIPTIVAAHEAQWMKVYPDSQDDEALWRKSYHEKYKTKLSFLTR